MKSRWYRATRHRAAGGVMLCWNGRPAGHAHRRAECCGVNQSTDDTEEGTAHGR